QSPSLLSVSLRIVLTLPFLPSLPPSIFAYRSFSSRSLAPCYHSRTLSIVSLRFILSPIRPLNRLTSSSKLHPRSSTIPHRFSIRSSIATSTPVNRQFVLYQSTSSVRINQPASFILELQSTSFFFYTHPSSNPSSSIHSRMMSTESYRPAKMWRGGRNLAAIREKQPLYGGFSLEEESPMLSLGRTLFGSSLSRRTMSCCDEVSVETMAITAMPKETIDIWLKERLKKWIQLSGHEGSIVPASLNSLYKKQSGLCTEGTAYKAIQNDPALCGFAPTFYQQIEKNNEVFIEIEDLLSRFAEPSQTGIMDIKIGTRTFLESEVSNTKLRKDLYDKMVAIDPSEATEEEKACGEITKLRYMQFRERESSSAALGFRIEAAKMPGGELQKNFKKVRTADDVACVFSKFFGSESERVSRALTQRLIALRDAIEKSTFFSEHEVVGSSLLVLFDKEQCGVWMIDFAKAVKRENVSCCRKLTHRDTWVPGNGEDGYLTGIDHLVKILRSLDDEDKVKTTTLCGR
ncbi:hypothetical protein PFISCL1PPCAC_18060, partial [Pristionchus fissidentatus]